MITGISTKKCAGQTKAVLTAARNGRRVMRAAVEPAAVDALLLSLLAVGHVSGDAAAKVWTMYPEQRRHKTVSESFWSKAKDREHVYAAG